MNEEINSIIERLKLKDHPEGGWYRNTYRSDLSIPASLHPGNDGERSCATSIYFLLSSNNFSAFHRLKSDEIWYHHSGSALAIEILDPRDGYTRKVIGPADRGYEPQAIAPAGTWFGSHLLEGGDSWSLVGCAVSPGFDFLDFELGVRKDLIAAFPGQSELISALTRN